MQSEMMKRASELLADGTVVRVLGWKNGEFVYDPTPAVFDSAEALEKDFVYHDFCGSNLSKYLIKLSKLEGKTLVFLKPCDSYSFNQLLTEHRIKRENVYIIGVPCDGKLDPDKVREAGAEGILGITTDGDTVKAETMYGEVSVSKKDCLLERCEVCKSHKVVVYDEMLGENGEENPESGRIRAENCQKAEWVNCGQGDADRRCALLSFSHRFQQSVERLVETQFFPRSRMFLMRVSTSSFKELSFWMDWEMLLTAYTMVE